MTLKELLGDAFKEGMSFEEIEKALEAIQPQKDESSQKEIERLTKALSKSNSEAAENKRKLQERMTEEEKLKEEREKAFNELTEKVKNLETEKALVGNKGQLIALGYDESLATETAQAMIDGDMSTVFANQKKFLDAQRSKIEAELLKKTPTPPAGGLADTLTREKYRAMPLAEKQKLATENPTLYKKMNTEE